MVVTVHTSGLAVALLPVLRPLLADGGHDFGHSMGSKPMSEILNSIIPVHYYNNAAGEKSPMSFNQHIAEITRETDGKRVMTASIWFNGNIEVDVYDPDNNEKWVATYQIRLTDLFKAVAEHRGIDLSELFK